MADLVPYSQAATTSLVSTLQNSDLMALAREDNDSDTGYQSKVTRVDTIAKKVVKETDYSDLQTTSKNPIGAINEVNTKASQFDNMTATASGSIATFSDGGDDIPVAEFECEIVAQQGSGTPSPSDPLAITGFSQADITVTDNDQITNLYTVAFGQTIYGGRLIYANGQWAIEVTHGYHEITGTENWAWAKSGTYTGGFYTPVSSVSAKANTPFICTHAKTVLSISDYAWGTCFCDGSFNFRIMQASDTIEDWKTYLANQYANGTPVSICFELATPTIIPLTSSTRIKTISGDNNIYSNTGDCEVKYFTNNADSLAELIKAFVV